MPKKPKKDELITLAQAAELSGFKVSYLYKLAQRGRLKCKRLGNTWVTTPGWKIRVREQLFLILENIAL